MICLGARLGAEVRAAKKLGALSIGVDIGPGGQNPHVLYGDFHELNFPSGVFDIAFTNAVDHVFDLDRCCRKVLRVLRPSGLFLVELALIKSGKYEVLDTSDLEPVLEIFERYFTLDWKDEIYNKTDIIDRRGLFCRF